MPRRRLLGETVTLQTPRGRLLAFALLSLLIYCARYSWLAHLSLWQDLGWRTAPSIGLTRAYWLLLHGHPVLAWRRNSLIYAVLAVGVPLLGYDCLKLASPLLHRTAPSPK
jgi:hypothetical protein